MDDENKLVSEILVSEYSSCLSLFKDTVEGTQLR